MVEFLLMETQKHSMHLLSCRKCCAEAENFSEIEMIVHGPSISSAILTTPDCGRTLL